MTQNWLILRTLIKRELMGYFYTPIAYIFLVVFLLFAGILPLQIGGFLDSGQAELTILFGFMPWLFVAFIPAVTMRSWAEESSSGTIEILLTLPVSTSLLVLGKFLAAWLFVSLAIILTAPFWVSVNILGAPDNGVIIIGYISTLLLAGCYVAIGCFISAITRAQIIAFICATTISFFLTLLGTQFVLDALKAVLGTSVYLFIANLGLLKHFQTGTRGILALRDLGYFLAFMALFLYLTGLFLRGRR